MDMPNIETTLMRSASNACRLKGVKKRTCLKSVRKIPVNEKEPIPEGTGLVCLRGGKTLQLIFWSNTEKRYELLRLPRSDASEYLVLGEPSDLPVTLALHFDLPINNSPRPSIVPGRACTLLGDIKLKNYLSLKRGGTIICDSVINSLGVFRLRCHGQSLGRFLLSPIDYPLLEAVVTNQTGGRSEWIH